MRLLCTAAMPGPEDVEAISLSELRSIATSRLGARDSVNLRRVDSKASVDLYPVASGSASQNASLGAIGGEEEDTTQLNESLLAPMDGGWRAWSFVSSSKKIMQTHDCR